MMTWREMFINNHGYDPGHDPPWAHPRPRPSPTPTPAPAGGDQTIELKVPFCCEKCVDKVRKKLNELDGVATIRTYLQSEKVTVIGNVKPEKVLKQVQTVVSGAKLVKQK